LYQRLGEFQLALDVLDELDLPSVPGEEHPIRAFAALLGGADSARAWLAAHPTVSALEPDSAKENHLLIVARLLTSAHRTNESIALLQKIIRFAKTNERIHTLIQADVALAVIASQPETLLTALTLAEPEGYLTTFTLEGEPLANMLQYLLRQPNLEPRLQTYARKILSAFEPTPRPSKPASGLVEPLSAREIEVLRYIAEGLSNPEIARRMYLSTNTLKAHTQNIFLKLEVHNRLQAVSRAKELGLIE